MAVSFKRALGAVGHREGEVHDIARVGIARAEIDRERRRRRRRPGHGRAGGVAGGADQLHAVDGGVFGQRDLGAGAADRHAAESAGAEVPAALVDDLLEAEP